jgi:undecaprenyl diphosphate synthase
VQAGVNNLWDIVNRCRHLRIPHLSVFAFSAENWKRSPEEVRALLHLMESSLNAQLDEALENGVRMSFFGDLERLPSSLRQLINRCVC